MINDDEDDDASDLHGAEEYREHLKPKPFDTETSLKWYYGADDDESQYDFVNPTPAQLRKCWNIDYEMEIERRHDISRAMALMYAQSLSEYKKLLNEYAEMDLEVLKIACVRMVTQHPDLNNVSDYLMGVSKTDMTVKQNAQAPTPRMEEYLRRHVVVHKVTHEADKKVDGENRKFIEFAEELSRPKVIAGPMTADDADVFGAALLDECPWMAEPTEAIWSSSKRNISDGRGFGFDPILLLGPPGTGKSYFSRSVARLADLPFVMLSGSNMTAVFDISGVEQNWKNASPAAFIDKMRSTGVANPIMLFDELDKCGPVGNGGNPQNALIPLLQRDTAMEYRCPYLKAPVDVSYVSWLICANSLKGINPAVLDRVRIINVDPPKGQALRRYAARVFDGVEMTGSDIDEIIRLVESGKISIRSMGRIADVMRRYDQRPRLN